METLYNRPRKPKIGTRKEEKVATKLTTRPMKMTGATPKITTKPGTKVVSKEERKRTTIKYFETRKQSSAQRRKNLRLKQIRLQGKRRHSKLSSEKFRKLWDVTRKKQHKIGKIRMPPREYKPTTINELDEEELRALPDTVHPNHSL